MKPKRERIMYIERKEGISGPARIGRVTFSNSGESIYYRGKMFQRLGGRGFKANYFDSETLEEYWISGCKRYGGDRLYSGTIEIDEEVREEYWVRIRNEPEKRDRSRIRVAGKYGGKEKRKK